MQKLKLTDILLQEFDGGDCCLEHIEDTYCTECFCYQDCSKHPNIDADCLDHPNINSGECHEYWISDGICDESCNFPTHDFDGGDCCLDRVTNNFCQDCFCYEDCTYHELYDYYANSECLASHPNHADTNECEPDMAHDGYCHDQCNFPEYDFDSGACCLFPTLQDFCIDCICYDDCSLHEGQEAIPLPPPNPDPISTPMPSHVEG